MKTAVRLITMAIALSLFSALAAAAPFGAIAGARITEPCSPSGGGYSCGPGITNPDKDEAFSSGVTSVSVSAQHPMAASSSSAAGMLDPGNLYLPVLTAYAASVEGDGAFAEVETINLYTYTGPDNFLLELTGLFHGTTTGVATSMYGSAALISVDDYDAMTAMDDFDNGYGPAGCFGECFQPLDNDSVSTTNGGEETLDITLMTEVDNGDQFYVWAKFGGASVGGGEFDGLSTATFSLNTTNVVSAAVVPLPGAVWLLLGAPAAACSGAAGARSSAQRQAITPRSAATV